MRPNYSEGATKERMGVPTSDVEGIMTGTQYGNVAVAFVKPGARLLIHIYAPAREYSFHAIERHDRLRNYNFVKNIARFL